MYLFSNFSGYLKYEEAIQKVTKLNQDEYQILFDKLNKPRIIYNGYRYGIKNLDKECNPKYWRCTLSSSKKCKATAIRSPDGSLIVKENHSHPPPIYPNPLMMS